MRPSLRTATIWAFTALFGCVSLLGQGWHSLLGEYHGAHSCCSHTSCCAEAPAQCGHGSACETEHEGHGHQEAHDCDETAAITLPSTGGHDAHLCPICCFFAQAQWNVDFQPAELTQVSCEWLSLAAESVPPARLANYQSRGPPMAAAL